MQAGFAKVDITPTRDDAGAFDILDPIFFRALHLCWDGGQVTFLAADLFVLDDRFLQLVTSDLATFDVDTDWILPGACHLGTGPTLFNHYVNQPTEALKQFGNDEHYAQAAARAIRLACRDATPAQIGVGVADAEAGLQYNRRAHDEQGDLRMVSLSEFATPPSELTYGDVDRQVGVLRVTRSGKPDVALVNFGCHALSLWDQRGNISGDFPGCMAARLAADGFDALFFQGALGNVHPVRQTADPCERIAVSLASTVRTICAATPVAGTAPGLRRHTIQLARRPTLDAEHARQLWEGRPQEAEGLARYNFWLADHFGDAATSDMTIRIVTIGTAAIVHMPGEPFVETVQAVRASSCLAPVLMLVNPCPELGYLPTPEARAEGGDEPLFAPLAEDSEPQIRQALVSLLSTS